MTALNMTEVLSSSFDIVSTMDGSTIHSGDALKDGVKFVRLIAAPMGDAFEGRIQIQQEPSGDLFVCSPTLWGVQIVEKPAQEVTDMIVRKLDLSETMKVVDVEKPAKEDDSDLPLIDIELPEDFDGPSEVVDAFGTYKDAANEYNRAVEKVQDAASNYEDAARELSRKLNDAADEIETWIIKQEDETDPVDQRIKSLEEQRDALQARIDSINERRETALEAINAAKDMIRKLRSIDRELPEEVDMGEEVTLLDEADIEEATGQCC